MATKLRETETQQERKVRKIKDIKADYERLKSKQIYTNEYIFRELAYQYYLAVHTIERYVYIVNFESKKKKDD